MDKLQQHFNRKSEALAKSQCALSNIVQSLVIMNLLVIWDPNTQQLTEGGGIESVTINGDSVQINIKEI
jgi:hypothetical protein